MTIRLLAKHGKYNANTIVTLDAATESGLLAAKLAITDLTGGVAYVEPAVPHQRYPVQVEFDGAGKTVGLVGPDGKLLSAGVGGPAGTSLRESNAKPLLQFMLAANFTISGTGATKEDSYSPLIAPQAIKINGTTAGGSANLDYTPSGGFAMDISQLDDFLIAFHTPDPSKFNGLTLFLGSDVSGFTNYYRVPLVGNLGDRGTGWNVHGWRKSDMVVSGAPDPTNIKQIRVQVASSAGGVVCTLDSIWANARTRAKAMIIFDDGWTEQYDYNNGHGMFTAMKARGLKGSVSIIGSRIGQASTLTFDQLREIDAAGFDLTVHGPGYAGAAAGYNNLNQFPAEDAAAGDVKSNREFLLAQGNSRGADFYVYPQGAYTETLIPKLRSVGITMARGTTEALCFPYFPAPDYLMKLPAVDIGGRTFAQIKVWIDRAIAAGATIILYGHRIQVAGGATGLFINQAEFEMILDYLVARSADIDTVTPTQWRSQVLASK